MSLVTMKYCDRCKKRIVEGRGADVMKHTVGMNDYPTLHLCERCFNEVFARYIKESKAKEV